MSDHLKSDLSAGQIALRVLFSIVVTAAVDITGYWGISWLAHLRPQ
jgi:hypothetical protein